MHTEPQNVSCYDYYEKDSKACYYKHKLSFKTLSKRHQTKLSKLVWRLEDEGNNPVIKKLVICSQTIQQRRNTLPIALGRKTGDSAGQPRHDRK